MSHEDADLHSGKRKHNHYRSTETILQINDALVQAMQTDVVFKILLNPPLPIPPAAIL